MVLKAMVNKAMVNKTMAHTMVNTLAHKNIDLDYQISLNSDEIKFCYTPELKNITRWIRALLEEIDYREDVQLTLRVVNEKEMIELNGTYRHKSVPTNVLAFPYEPIEGVSVALIGDVVICAAVVRQQAIEQKKTDEQHWAHLIVHGTLHLLGFDHKSKDETTKMESVEKAILSKFKYPDPYTEILEDR